MEEKKPSVIQEPTLADALLVLIAYIKECDAEEQRKRGLWDDIGPGDSKS